MVLALPAKEAVAVMLPLLILCDFVSCWFYRRDWEGRPLLCFLPACVAGVALGTWLLGVVDGGGLRRMLGGICLVFCGWQWSKHLWFRNQSVRPPGWGTGSAFGLAAGVISTLAHAAGPVFAMYLLPQRYSPRLFVGTSVIAFTFINLIKVPGYLALDLLTDATLVTAARLSPALLAGTLAGVWLNRRLTGTAFTRTIYVLLFLTGVYLAFMS